jgi:GntR family transcriptional regulator / MocR family aminotransferase
MERATQTAADEARRASELLLELRLQRGQLRQEITEVLRAAVQDGRLAAGTPLPASRRLAVELGVSRGVLTDVYDQLASEGYLDIRPRSAPTVAAVFAAPTPWPEPRPPRWRFDFNATTPDVGLFPRRAWGRAVERALREAPDAAFDYGFHQGHHVLRVALSAYLGRARAVRVDPGRVVVTQGFTQALDLLCRVLASRGARTMAMETPSHPAHLPSMVAAVRL